MLPSGVSQPKERARTQEGEKKQKEVERRHSIPEGGDGNGRKWRGKKGGEPGKLYPLDLLLIGKWYLTEEVSDIPKAICLMTLEPL